MDKQIVYIKIENLNAHPDNPRKELGDLSELAESIRANGIFQNLTVVPFRSKTENRVIEGLYTVIIGHRRMAAAKLAGLTELPCVIADMTEKEQLQTMLMENMQRSDLTVYEQAQGFQLMLDLGSTVEEIAEKSGFSTATVKRRVKMMELDQEKLKEVSTRQITLGDFDTLAQIEDIADRNKALESIGTKDFDLSVSRALSAQADRKNRPIVKAWLKEVGAEEISNKDSWSNKYESYPGCSYYIYIAKWGEEGNTPPKSVKEPVFYVLDSNSVRLFRKREKPKPEKKSEKALERERAIQEAWKALHDTAAIAYDLRRKFVEGLMLTGRNRQDILYGALLAHLLEAIDYNSPDRDTMHQIFGMDEKEIYSNTRGEKLLDGLGSLTDKDIPALVYAGFGDNKKQLCCGTAYSFQFPGYVVNAKLEILYKWLESLGYEKSTEEIRLLNGEHEAYHAGEAYKEESQK